jgi:predicted nucleic acid-binding protein
MLNPILIDAGPLIALFDRDDAFHGRVIEFIKDKKLKLITTLPVALEVYHMLDFDIMAQIVFSRWVSNKGLQVLHIGNLSIEEAINLMKKYIDHHLNITSASLFSAAKNMNINKIISIDFDYYVNLNIGGLKIENIFPR